MLPDRRDEGACGWRDAVRILATPTPVSQPFVLECPAAVALALWDRHSVQPLARRLFGAPVARIDHLGSFAMNEFTVYQTLVLPAAIYPVLAP